MHYFSALFLYSAFALSGKTENPEIAT